MHRLMPIEIFDWYDGIVLALVSPSWREEIFLASILSWSQRDRLRALALLPVTQEQAEEIKHRASGEWDQFLAHVKGLYEHLAAETVPVVRLDEARDEIVAENMVARADVSGAVGIDIQEALEPERERWLRLA